MIGRLPVWKTQLAAWATAAWQWIIDAAALIPAKITEWYNGLKAAIDAKLPTWKLAFMEWRIATTQWIADSIALIPAKIVEWYTSLTTNLSPKLTTFKTEMLKWATGLVEWIGSSAADALPELGKWLGKITAWIAKVAIALPLMLIKLAKALVGWITGPDADPDPEVEKFQAALGKALVQIGSALLGFMGEFAKAFMDELGIGFLAEKDGLTKKIQESIDLALEKLGVTAALEKGKEILNNFRTGFEAVRESVYNAVTLFKNRIIAFFDVEKWIEQGKAVIKFIKDGLADVPTLGELWGAIKQFGLDAIAEFAKTDWVQIGKDIIAGAIAGIDAKWEEFKLKIQSLGEALPQWMQDMLGIGSPSKVFAEIGVNIIQGLIVGCGGR